MLFRRFLWSPPSVLMVRARRPAFLMVVLVWGLVVGLFAGGLPEARAQSLSGTWTFAFESEFVAEGDTGYAVIELSAAQSADAVFAITVDTGNSTADSPADYTVGDIPSSITIPEGETQFAIPIETKVDDVAEATEYIYIEATGPGGGLGAGAHQQTYIYIVNVSKVDVSWPLVPPGVKAGDRFRLLFMTSGTRDATPTTNDDYFTMVENAAGSGHASIQDYKDTFGPVVSTGGGARQAHAYVNAAMPLPIFASPENFFQVPVHWLGQTSRVTSRAAGSNAQFWSGAWDDGTSIRDEHGNTVSSGNHPDFAEVWTGTRAGWTNATRHAEPAPGTSSANKMGNGQVTYGEVSYNKNTIAAFDRNSDGTRTLLTAPRGEQRHLLAVSGIFEVTSALVPVVKFNDPTLTQTVTEGEQFSPVIVADPAPALLLPVRVRVTETTKAGAPDYIPSAQEGEYWVDVTAAMDGGQAGIGSFNIGPVDNTIDGKDGEVTVEILPGPGYVVDRHSSKVVRPIVDDDPTAVTVTLSSGVVQENGGTVDVTYRLSNPLAAGEKAQVRINTGGNAVQGTHYTLAQHQLGSGAAWDDSTSPCDTTNPCIVFEGPGEPSATVRITSIDDTTAYTSDGTHNDRTLDLTPHAEPTNGSYGLEGEKIRVDHGPRSSRVRFIDAQTTYNRTVGFTKGTFDIAENHVLAEPILTFNNAPAADGTLKVTVSNGSGGKRATKDADWCANSPRDERRIVIRGEDGEILPCPTPRVREIMVDYLAGSGNIQFNAVVMDDKELEGNEYFTVTLDTANLPSGITAGPTTTAEVKIIDNEKYPVTVDAVRGQAIEGSDSDTGLFRITLNEGHSLRGHQSLTLPLEFIGDPDGYSIALADGTPGSVTLGTLTDSSTTSFGFTSNFRTGELTFGNNAPGSVDLVVTGIQDSDVLAETVTLELKEQAGPTPPATAYAQTGIELLEGRIDTGIGVVYLQEGQAKKASEQWVTVDVTDDEGGAEIEFGVDRVEGREGQHARIPVDILRPVLVDKWIPVTYTGGTASDGADFSSARTLVRIPKGETRGWLEVPLHEDTVVEGDESFTVTFNSSQLGSNDTLLDATDRARVDIKDTNYYFSFDKSSHSTEEHWGGAVVKVIMTGDPLDCVRTAIHYADRTAVAGTHFRHRHLSWAPGMGFNDGYLEFCPGETKEQYVYTPVIRGSVQNSNKVFNIGLGYITHAQPTGIPGSAITRTQVFLADEHPDFSFPFHDVKVAVEGPTRVTEGQTAKFKITMTPPKSQGTWRIGYALSETSDSGDGQQWLRTLKMDPANDNEGVLGINSIEMPDVRDVPGYDPANPPSSTSVIVEVPIQRDERLDTGKIKIALLPVGISPSAFGAYRTGSPSYAEVEVHDGQTDSDVTPRLSVSLAGRNVNGVLAGRTARFTINAEPHPDHAVPVRYRVTMAGDFVDAEKMAEPDSGCTATGSTVMDGKVVGGTWECVTTLPRNARFGDITVPTKDDGTYYKEPFGKGFIDVGKISVSLLPDDPPGNDRDRYHVTGGRHGNNGYGRASVTHYMIEDNCVYTPPSVVKTAQDAETIRDRPNVTDLHRRVWGEMVDTLSKQQGPKWKKAAYFEQYRTNFGAIGPFIEMVRAIEKCRKGYYIGDFQGSDSPPVSGVPTETVANLQVTADDDTSATATWNPVPYAHSYYLEYQGQGTDPNSYIYASKTGVTGTSWTFTHNAPEEMVITVTVAPVHETPDGILHPIFRLSASADLDLANPTTTTCTPDLPTDAVTVSEVTGWRDGHSGAAHVLRWNQVLEALGEDTGSGATAMTADESEANESTFMASRWDRVTRTLEAIEACPETDTTTTTVPPSTTPEVSIASDGDITEGGTATFTLTANPAPAADLDVTVAVAQSGDYGVATGIRTVTIPTTGSASLTVATIDDSTDELDGSVTAGVADGTDYTVSTTAGVATAVVSDDDAAPPVTCTPNLPTDAVTVSEVTAWRDGHSGAAHVLRWNRVLEALGEDTGSGATPMTVTQSEANESTFMRSRWDRVTRTLEAMEACDTTTTTVVPPPTPEVSIASDGDVTEGGAATFTLTANPAPTSALSVTVSVTQSGDYGVTTGSRTVTIGTGGTGTLTVTTADDSADEADGTVTATITDRADYDVSATAGSATAAVADDDPPIIPPPPPPATLEISITADGDITEGGTATFTLTANPAPTSPLDVTVAVAQTGDYGVTTGTRTVTIATSGTGTLTVATSDDSADESDGSVTATIDDGAGYTVSANAGAATVNVADDDATVVVPPPVTDPEISASDASASEDAGTMTFTVELSAPSNRVVKVRYSVGGPGSTAYRGRDFEGVYGELVFQPGETSKTVDIVLLDDSLVEGDETFGFWLSYARGGATIPDNHSEGTIIDDD